jgi:hypothetical protein
VKAFIRIGAVVIAGMLATAGGANAADTQLPLPDVTVTAPGVTNTPPYLRDPGKSFSRNPYAGRFRVEEDKFVRVPCVATRVAAATGGTCLQGYKLTPGSMFTETQFNPCDLALDVTMFENARVTVEADILIFDPYKVTATGSVSRHCYVRDYTGYDAEDFQDMNQVTRRGVNFRNLVGAGDDKAIEFDDGSRHCKAIRHTGPRWQGGYVYIGHISICRKDAAQVQAEDVAYVFNDLRVRIYDPDGNLRGPDADSAPVAPLPSDPNVELRPR